METEDSGGSFTTYEEIFSLTGSPYLNELIKACEAYYNEPEHNETLIENIKNRLMIFQEISKSLELTFDKIKKTQDKTPIIEEHNAIIEENLLTLQESLRILESFLITKDRETMIAGIFNAKISTENLFYAFETLKTEEENLGYYSQSPHFNELIRITDGVIRGDFPPEELKERIDWMMAYWEKSYNEFLSSKNAGMANQQVMERLILIEAAFIKCGNSLKLMDKYFEDNDINNLVSGVNEIKEASDELIEHFEFIQKESTNITPKKNCCYCGKANEISAKFCVECDAVIPGFTPSEEKSEINIKIGDNITIDNRRVITSHIQKLIELVTSVIHGNGSLEDLQKFLAWLWQKIQIGKENLSKMKMPDNVGDEEDRTLLEKSQHLMGTGVMKLETAIREIHLYTVDGNLDHLSQGMNIAISGNDDIWEVQSISRQIWEKYHPQ